MRRQAPGGKSVGEQRRIPIPYFQRRRRATANYPRPVEKPYREPRCYHQNEMKPQTIGRALGIGLRVAGRIASQQLAGSAHASASQSAPAAGSAPSQVGQIGVDPIRVGQVAGQAKRGVVQGVGGFLKPFRRVGGILWLEVTGVFFALPVVVFGPVLWRTRLSWAHGPDHRTFLVTAGIVVLFLYLSVSSFWRARRR
jgi:hypothetical protein